MVLLGPNPGTPGCRRPTGLPPEIDPLDVYQKVLATLHSFLLTSPVEPVRKAAHRRADFTGKLTRYILVKRPVGDNSEFLKQAGYTLNNGQRLEQDLRWQILSKEAISTEQTRYGEYFEIVERH